MYEANRNRSRAYLEMIKKCESEKQVQKRIALVGSIRATLAPLERVLMKLGYVTDCFYSESTLLQKTKAAPPDVIIIESEIDNFTSVELVKIINALGLKIPIIMLTNDSDVFTAVEALKYGALDYLEKPVVDSVIARVVNKALDSNMAR